MNLTELLKSVAENGLYGQINNNDRYKNRITIIIIVVVMLLNYWSGNMLKYV